MNESGLNLKRICSKLPYLLLGIILVVVISKKINYHVDEVYSYGLANHKADGEKNMTIKNGIKYVPANKPWMDYVTVSKDNKFNYKSVWDNQGVDTHPPLYYAVLHTICSFFPESFSVWYAGIINIFFSLVSMFMLRKILRLYFENSGGVLTVASFMFALSPAFVNMATFMRMYVMASCVVLGFTYYFICSIQKKSIGTYVGIVIMTILGTLTHYYCMFYIVCCSVVYGCFLIFNKRWRDFIKYGFSMLVSALLSIAIFPKIIHHLFEGNRGKQALNNASGMEVFLKNIMPMMTRLCREFVGHYCVAILVLLGVALFLVKQRKNIRIPNEVRIIFVSLLLYFIVVAAMAPYSNTRYYYPVYGNLFFVVVFVITKIILSNREVYFWICSIGLCMIVFFAWKNVVWDYLYSDDIVSLEWAQQYFGKDCLIVHSSRFKLYACMEEVKYYKSSYFVNHKNLTTLLEEDSLGGEDFVLIICGIDNIEGALEEVKTLYHNYECISQNQAQNHVSYYFKYNN
ncbi:glycosyltransferase family 39 protein [Butyrivibrio sp. AC2005]|uniref:glycosyltransferase family 39 protein n=1 Tax=Butyrivibrio sp. AC2005 TaxID=1280672 RepID=UPI0004139F12|nr:glycosyltransferase family 39 protein [Butyrivibrio sp. AC2005]